MIIPVLTAKGQAIGALDINLQRLRDFPQNSRIALFATLVQQATDDNQNALYSAYQHPQIARHKL